MITILFCAVVHFGSLWGQNADSLRTIEVDEIVVRSARSLRDIGVQKSILNEAVLKENLAATMAEVLAQNSTIFIKSSGRASLSTASLRGTAPSHTSVSWNGVELGSPMLGMADFSLIPSYFVDGSEIYHGATSVNVAGGGLGGAVALSTQAPTSQGFDIQYIQNIASYSTHDEFVRLGYSGRRWSTSTRVLNSASQNDFPYINYDKVGHPLEYNKSCGYHDIHLLQELFANGKRGGKWSLKAWYTDSSRGIPKLSVDYRDDDLTKAWQEEKSLRSVGEWRRSWGGLRLSASGGYNIDNLHYIYQFSKGGGAIQRAVDSRSLTVHTFAGLSAEWSIGNRLMLAGQLGGRYYSVDSEDVAPLIPVGFVASRKELSSFFSARWKPLDWLGVAASLRDEWRDGVMSPAIPALFVDVTLVERWGLIVSGSASRNYHHPTLNDLYFVPGGNPDLQPEEGTTFDLGAESTIRKGALKVSAKATLFRSDIVNWIMWTPTIKGFWTPENIAAVRSEGVESRASINYRISEHTNVSFNAIFAYTLSENNDPQSANYGKQLPYIPRVSSSAGIHIAHNSWEADLKNRYYSDRYTSYSGTSFGGGVVPAYAVSDFSVGHTFEGNKVRFKVRLEVNNLLNTTYQSVLSRPMPPRNYALSVECRWRQNQ